MSEKTLKQSPAAAAHTEAKNEHDHSGHTHSHVHEHASHSHTHDHDGHPHSHDHEHAHGHHHVHSEEEKKAVVNRLSRAIGHLEKVKRMVMNDEDCSDVLIQLAAVRSALNSTGKVILTNHIDHCITEAVQENDMETIAKLEEAINKFIK